MRHKVLLLVRDTLALAWKLLAGTLVVKVLVLLWYFLHA
jgi:hypothetical protein